MIQIPKSDMDIAYEQIKKVQNKKVVKMEDMSEIYENIAVKEIKFYGESVFKPGHYLFSVITYNNVDNAVYVKI